MTVQISPWSATNENRTQEAWQGKAAIQPCRRQFLSPPRLVLRVFITRALPAKSSYFLLHRSQKMSLTIPQASQAGLFKPGYNSYDAEDGAVIRNV